MMWPTVEDLAEKLGITAGKIRMTVEPDDLHTVEGVTYARPRAVHIAVMISPWRNEIEERVTARMHGEDAPAPFDPLSSWDVAR